MNNAKWSGAVAMLNRLAASTELSHSIKWGGDYYSLGKKRILSFGGFKNHFAVWFIDGVFLSDPYKVLVNANEEKTRGLRQWRFTSIEEMDEEKIMEYILESIQNAKDGKAIKPKKFKSIETPEVLQQALDEDPLFSSAFAKLTPGRQKEYMEHLNEAKREETKWSRVYKIIPLVLDGKGLHDKYK